MTNELLQTLTEAVGPSGAEKEVRRLIFDRIKDAIDDWWVDPMGNLIALKRGTGASDMRVMVDAHMDEIGVIITGIDSHGALEFAKLGGIDDRVLAGSVMQVGPKKYRGVIGLKPVHLSGASERNKPTAGSDLRIDIGAKSKDNAASLVRIGDRGTFWSPYEEIGAFAIGKAFDNRAACAALIELLHRDRFPFDLYAAFTVQEEIGLRGAPVAAYRIKPDVALVLECTPAFDFPSEEAFSPNTRPGHGPALYVMDSRTIQHPRLVQHLMRTGERHDIPYQVRQPGGGGTNTGAIQRTDVGCPAATIGLPGRHAHTPNMMIHLGDYANYVRLADMALRDLTREALGGDGPDRA